MSLQSGIKQFVCQILSAMQIHKPVNQRISKSASNTQHAIPLTACPDLSGFHVSSRRWIARMTVCDCHSTSICHYDTINESCIPALRDFATLNLHLASNPEDIWGLTQICEGLVVCFFYVACPFVSSRWRVAPSICALSASGMNVQCVRNASRACW